MASACVVARPRGRFWRALNAIGLAGRPPAVVRCGGALADHESSTLLFIRSRGWDLGTSRGRTHSRVTSRFTYDTECRAVVPRGRLRGNGTGLVSYLEFHRALGASQPSSVIFANTPSLPVRRLG